MSKHITISGSDLEYFKGIVSQALSGDFGQLTEVRISVHDEDGILIGANGHLSEYFGSVESDPPYGESSSDPERLGDILRRLAALEAMTVIQVRG